MKAPLVGLFPVTFDLSPRPIDTLDAAGSNVCAMPTFVDSESGLPGRKKLDKPVGKRVIAKPAAPIVTKPAPVKAPK